MNDAGLQRGAADERSTAGLDRLLFHVFLVLRRIAVTCRQAISLALAPEDESIVRLTQASRRLDECIEYRLQVERGAADHLEDVGGGGLLLQRFSQLVEQARVFDGDDGLAGEISDQLDLLVREGANLKAIDANNTD